VALVAVQVAALLLTLMVMVAVLEQQDKAITEPTVSIEMYPQVVEALVRLVLQLRQEQLAVKAEMEVILIQLLQPLLALVMEVIMLAVARGAVTVEPQVVD
jgi:hypothetical protein